MDLELADFNKEEATSWSVIKKNEPSSKPRSFADAVKSGLLSGANYGMHLEEMPNRLLMVRAVASSRSQPQNKNVAIATINRLPGNPLNFLVVREVLREFLVDRQHVHITDI